MQNVDGRAVKSTYFALLTVWVLLLLLTTAAAFSDPSFWKVFGAVVFALSVLFAWIRAFMLQVVDNNICYRSLFAGTRSISLSQIDKAEIAIGVGGPFAPFYRLLIYPTNESGKAPITINMKVFSKEALGQLLDILGPKLKGKRRFSVFEAK